jgi:hypothetical protein
MTITAPTSGAELPDGSFTDIQDLTRHPDWEPSESRPLTVSPVRTEAGYAWEMDEAGWHRIVDPQGRGGPWAAYQSPAVSPEGRHVAFTQCFEGLVPCERVIELRPLT